MIQLCRYALSICCLMLIALTSPSYGQNQPDVSITTEGRPDLIAYVKNMARDFSETTTTMYYVHFALWENGRAIIGEGRSIPIGGTTAAGPYYEHQIPAASASTIIKSAVTALEKINESEIATWPPGANPARIAWTAGNDKQNTLTLNEGELIKLSINPTDDTCSTGARKIYNVIQKVKTQLPNANTGTPIDVNWKL